MPTTNPVKLSDGREVKIDLYKMTVKDWRDLDTSSVDGTDAVVCKCTGLTQEELEGMPFPDYILLTRTLAKFIGDPLSDPN